MMDEYQRSRYRDGLLLSGWRIAAAAIGVLAACAVTANAITSLFFR